MTSYRTLLVATLFAAYLITKTSASFFWKFFPWDALFLTNVKYPICFIGKHRIVRMHETWYDRCSKCTCDPDLGPVCDGPKCRIPYKPYHNDTCVQWSEDQCCCEKFGCEVGGEVYQIGQYYPFPVGDPCGECLCEMDTDYPKCGKKICAPEVCVDATQLPGECCRRCLRGPNCRYPSLKGVDTFTNRALRRPLLFTTSELVQSDENPLMFYECICTIPGGTAKCTPKPFQMVG